MTAKEYLEQYKEAERVVANIKAEYLEQMEQIDNIRSALGGDGLPQSGDISKKVESQAVQLAAKAEELLTVEAAALALRQEIYRTVQSVPGDPRSVLIERYINLRKWVEIADLLGYTERQCYNIHDKGLEIVENLINPETFQ